jgi:hypothetical protein
MDKETLRMQMLAGIITENQYKIILNEAFINNKGELEDFDFEDNNTLSEEEWDRYYNEYKKNYKFNWLLRQLDILDGEEEKTKYAWNYSTQEIIKEFKTNPEAASIIFDIFQILKTTITHWTSLPDPEYSKYRFEIDDIIDNMSNEEAIEFMKHPDQTGKNKLLRLLTNDLFKWATPKELINIYPQAWEVMAWGDYDDYIDLI